MEIVNQVVTWVTLIIILFVNVFKFCFNKKNVIKVVQIVQIMVKVFVKTAFRDTKF